MPAQLVSIEAAPDLVDQVYRALLGAISSGTLAPGERITQEDIAQRLEHGLARHREALSDVFLRDAFARRERAAADGAEQGAVDLVDEIGGDFDAEELGGHVGFL